MITVSRRNLVSSAIVICAQCAIPGTDISRQEREDGDWVDPNLFAQDYSPAAATGFQALASLAPCPPSLPSSCALFNSVVPLLLLLHTQQLCPSHPPPKTKQKLLQAAFSSPCDVGQVWDGCWAMVQLLDGELGTVCLHLRWTLSPATEASLT